MPLLAGLLLLPALAAHSARLSPRVAAPAVSAAPAGALAPAAPSLASASLAVPAAAVLGPRPAALQDAQVEALQAASDGLGRALVVETARPGALGEAGALTLGVVGTREQRAAADRIWDGRSVPGGERGLERAFPSVEQAVGTGRFVVAPARWGARLDEPGREARELETMAEPYRTARQLDRVARDPRGDGERFTIAAIGDAEPGRFWFSRRLFNPDPGMFWKLLGRADKLSPDLIMLMGDLVSRGTVANFHAFFLKLLATAVKSPLLSVIGNHDRRKPHGVTDSRIYGGLFGSTDYAFDRGGWRFVVLDSSAGRLTAEQLRWLDKTLVTGRSVVFTHMPPAPLGEFADWGRIKGHGGFKTGAEQFMHVVKRHRVARVYMGHVHALGAVERDGVRYVLTGGGGSPLYPHGKHLERRHHFLTIEFGPDGPEETVHYADGQTRPLTWTRPRERRAGARSRAPSEEA